MPMGPFRDTDYVVSVASETKPTNPKDAIGSGKLPLHLWPMTATALGSLALLDGALKYGRSNWRHAGVRASIYTDALGRHMAAWMEGEDADPDSGLPHLAHALACIAIIIDAQAAGKLTDDRMFPGGHRALMDRLAPHVARLKAKHAGKTPHHYTATSGVPDAPPADAACCDAFRRGLDPAGCAGPACPHKPPPPPPPARADGAPACVSCGDPVPGGCPYLSCPHKPPLDPGRLIPRAPEGGWDCT